MVSPEIHAEIERKFLVATLPPDVERHPRQKLRQGYLVADADTSVRLRTHEDGWMLTVKRGRGLRRTEAEIALTRAQFDVLWPLTAGARLEKTRYHLPFGPYTIELDCYAGALAGLLTAEVEFPTEAAAHAFEPPAWFGADVTGDARYLNLTLARDGLPST